MRMTFNDPNVLPMCANPETGTPTLHAFDIGRRLLACGQGLTLRELAFVLQLSDADAEFFLADIEDEHVVWESDRGGEKVYRIVELGRLAAVDLEAE